MTTGTSLPSRGQRGGKAFQRALQKIDEFVTIAIDKIDEVESTKAGAQALDALPPAIQEVRKAIRRTKGADRRNAVDIVCEFVAPSASGAAAATRLLSRGRIAALRDPRVALGLFAVGTACTIERAGSRNIMAAAQEGDIKRLLELTLPFGITGFEDIKQIFTGE